MAISLKNIEDRVKALETAGVGKNIQVEYKSIQEAWITSNGSEKIVTVPDITQWHFIIIDWTHEGTGTRSAIYSMVVIPIFELLVYGTIIKSFGSDWEWGGATYLTITKKSNTSLGVKTMDYSSSAFSRMYLMRTVIKHYLITALSSLKKVISWL